jgi:hypothetical protein
MTPHVTGILVTIIRIREPNHFEGAEEGWARDDHKREHEPNERERGKRERTHVFLSGDLPLPPTQVAIGFGHLLFTCSRPDVINSGW